MFHDTNSNYLCTYLPNQKLALGWYVIKLTFNMHLLSFNNTIKHLVIAPFAGQYCSLYKNVYLVANTFSLQVLENSPLECEGLSTEPCTFDSESNFPDNLSDSNSCPGIEAISDFFPLPFCPFVLKFSINLGYDSLKRWIVFFSCMFMYIDAIYLIFSSRKTQIIF